MRLFKATYKGRDGQMHESERWYCEFRDHNEIKRRWPLFENRAASEEVARKIERLVASRLSGMEPEAGLVPWLDTLTDDLRQKMADIGLISALRMAAGKTLEEHLADYKAALEAEGVTAKHANLAHGRPKSIVDGCNMRVWQDITADAVRAWLHKKWKAQEISAQTHNYYVRDFKAFCNWMVNEKRARENPATNLGTLSDKTVKKEDHLRRRALSVDEIGKLLTATAAAPSRFGCSGQERALIYRCALETGLRAGEIGALTRANFRLDDAHPAVVATRGESKNGKNIHLPLRPEFVAVLKEHFANKLPAAKAFPIPTSDDTADMLRADLVAASIPEELDGQRVDFHALRHSYCTLLGASGVHPTVMRDLARHSDINTTMRYTHSALEHREEAIAKLPTFDTTAATEAVKTGTDDQPIAPSANSKHNDKQQVAEGTKTAQAQRLGHVPERISNPQVEGSIPPGNVSSQVNQSAEVRHDSQKSITEQQAERQAELPADLAAVVAAWPTLPGHIKAAITALVSKG